MELIHNQVFKIISVDEPDPYLQGVYRVLFSDYHSECVVCVRISSEKLKTRAASRHKTQAVKKKKAKPPLVGELIWMEESVLDQLFDTRTLVLMDIEREAIYSSPLTSPWHKEIHERRKVVMAGFLDPEHLKEQIIVNSGLGGLVREAMATSNASKGLVYLLWSTLCRLGLTASSLIPRLDRSGARGVPRPCDPGGRQKAGRKTLEQRNAKLLGGDTTPQQPGMSTDWTARIMAADRMIKTEVKPNMTTRHEHILNSSFVQHYRYEGDKLVAVDLPLGSYPSLSQTRRVLMREIPKLEQLRLRTTEGHFLRSLRGLVARNWQGVAGPGHTWAIDSTVGDLYLRSSINRAWIIGRPVVYVIVDVWSTAVVGFYVCLTGPSWNTAKVAIFNTSSPPELLGDLWGYQPILSLSPHPTLCHKLLCDRGEYLSKGASSTALELKLDLAYTPPYRPDLKGLVEVLHRIQKDQMFLFVPGALDARRAEFDLRQSNPAASAMTVKEFVHYLHIMFARYNLCANRAKRVDAHMKAAGVFPSPAGLWTWGHAMRVGFARHIPLSELLTTLLPTGTGSVGTSSVVFGKNDYTSEVIQNENWTTFARNSGRWKIPVNYYPGSVAQIWTPHSGHDGLLDLHISDQSLASPELTFDEVLDADALSTINNRTTEHERLLRALHAGTQTDDLIKRAKKATKEAEQKHHGSRPSMTEARIMEVASAIAGRPSEAKTKELLRDEAMEAHEQLMRSLLDSKSEGSQA
jgi:putative transposase